MDTLTARSDPTRQEFRSRVAPIRWGVFCQYSPE